MKYDEIIFRVIENYFGEWGDVLKYVLDLSLQLGISVSFEDCKSEHYI